MNTQISFEIVDRLYRIAPRLRSEWDSVPLREDFDTSVILAVVRTLEKAGTHKVRGGRRTAVEQARFAEALMRKYWKRSAVRDYCRHAERLKKGIRMDICLDDIAEQAAHATFYESAGTDHLGGETGREVAQFLEVQGLPREQAWAMVLWLTGRPWDDVTELLNDRFDLQLTTETVRQWQKKFAKMLPEVRRFLT
jgi:hypothetical protein